MDAGTIVDIHPRYAFINNFFLRAGKLRKGVNEGRGSYLGDVGELYRLIASQPSSGCWISGKHDSSVPSAVCTASALVLVRCKVLDKVYSVAVLTVWQLGNLH